MSPSRSDIESKHWQKERDGLAAIVRLVKYDQSIIVKNLDRVVKDVHNECKNLRSQVN